MAAGSSSGEEAAARVTPFVTAETTPPDTRIYKQYKGQSRPNMLKTASQTGQYGRKGGRSVFVSNQSAGRSIGDSALEDENLLRTVKVEDCLFEMGDCRTNILKQNIIDGLQ